MNSVIYFWYDHMLLRTNGEAEEAQAAIAAHDFDAFNRFRQRYGDEYFPTAATIFDDNDEVAGFLDITTPENFAKIDYAEYECG